MGPSEQLFAATFCCAFTRQMLVRVPFHTAELLMLVRLVPTF